MRRRTRPGSLLLLVAVLPVAVGAADPAAVGIYKAALEERGRRTREISTDEMRRVVKDGSVVILDVRPPAAYAIGHIPGAKNVAGRAGSERSRWLPDADEVARLLGEDRKTSVVLYCDGPWSEASRRLADELVAAGYRNVRRYQLGMPVWRALGEVCAVDFEGFRAVMERDRTAVVIDAREEKDFAAGKIPGAKNLPKSLVQQGGASEIRHAIDDGRLPIEDRGTRIFVLGEDGASARLVAEAIAREAFYDVSFFDGSFAQASAAPGR